MSYKLINNDKLEKMLREARDEAFERGYEDGKYEGKERIEELEDRLDNKNAELKKKNREIANLDTELEVLTKQKTDARSVVTQRLANENTAAELKSREELVSKREKKVTEREEKVSTAEVDEQDKQYKAGYADGVADGVRKIGEITQVDRQNAMDVAMVSAASHTQPEIVKAVLDGSKEIKSSLTNKEDK